MTKVLVVEDDYFSSQLVFEILTAQGFKAEIASDGPEAISMTENEVYDLILMDIELTKKESLLLAWTITYPNPLMYMISLKK